MSLSEVQGNTRKFKAGLEEEIARLAGRVDELERLNTGLVRAVIGDRRQSE